MISNRLVLLGAVRKIVKDEYARGSNSGDLGEEDGIFNASIFKDFYSPPAFLHKSTPPPHHPTPSHINPHVNFCVTFLP